MTSKVDLTGLSPQECPYACNPMKGCAITGSICGHPFKGGLQGALQSNPDVVTTFNQARRMLHKQKLNVGGEEETDAGAPAKSAQRKRRKAKPKPTKPAPAPQPEAPSNG